MVRNYDPEDLDPEERAWEALKAKAAARRAQAHSMAGMPSMTLKDYDEQRRQQMLRDQESLKASQVTPGSLTGSDDPFAIDTSISVPGDTPEISVSPVTSTTTNTAPAQTQAPDNMAVFWTCRVEDNLILYTHTWEEMKSRLVKHPGLWTATEHRFENTPANILGFFVPNQHVFPANTTVKQFEIIVKDGKVFKAET